jgi:hypothetical protein
MYYEILLFNDSLEKDSPKQRYNREVGTNSERKQLTRRKIPLAFANQ